MHRNIRTAAVAFVIFIGASGLPVAAETAAPSTQGSAATLLRRALATPAQHIIPIPIRLRARLEWKTAVLKWATIHQRIIRPARRIEGNHGYHVVVHERT